MDRRRLVAFVVILVLVAVAVGRYEPIIEQGQMLVESTPDPVVIAIASLAVAVVGVYLLVKLAGLVYPLVQRIFGSVMRFWDYIMPESVVVRFGIGITVMALLFLVGPLVVLQTLELGDSGDPVGDQNGADAGSESDDETDDDGGNTTDDSNDDQPDSPDEPPGGNSTDDGDGNVTGGNSTSAVAVIPPPSVPIAGVPAG